MCVEMFIPASSGKCSFAEHAELGVDKDMGGVDCRWELAVAELGWMKGRDGKMDRGVDACA